MKPSVYGFTAQAVALAATFGLSLTGPHRASAAPAAPIAQNDSSPAVTILSPVPRTSFSGVKPVEISAFYQGGAGNQIVSLELYVDGVKAAQKVLDNPEARGVVSFLIDASALTDGTHRIVVRATSADAQVSSAKSSFTFSIPSATAVAPPTSEAPVPGASLGSPRLSIDNPEVSGQVQGKVKIRVKAEDPSGKPPYVSLFIDRNFKTLRNYAPYEFEWDTTQYSNGYHTIDAFGYNDAQDVGHAQSIRVLVNNPGGQTQRRTDLQDAPKAAIRPSLPAKVGTITRTANSAKAAPIRRRPTPAMLSQAGHPTSAKRSAQIVRLPGITSQVMGLTGQPGLTDPFVEKTATSISAPSPTPIKGFKPMIRIPVEQAKLILARVATAPSEAAPYLLSVRSGQPIVAAPRSIMTATTVSPIRARVHTVTAARPRVNANIRAMLPAVVSHASSIRPLMGHTLRPAAHLDWLHATGQKVLMFNSSKLSLDRPLASQGSVLFGPLRQIFESGGASLMWHARTGTVTAHSKNRDMRLTIGQKSAVINHSAVTLDAAPYLNQGRTMIPLSFLKAAINVNVQYDSATGHLQISSKN